LFVSFLTLFLSRLCLYLFYCYGVMVWFGFMVLNATYISVISWQLYWCRKPDYPEKITDLSKVNDNVASSTSILSGVRTHNYHTITANLWCHGVLWRVCVCVCVLLLCQTEHIQGHLLHRSFVMV